MEYPPPITEAHRTALNNSLCNVTLDFIDELEAERRLNFAQSICVALESRIKGNFYWIFCLVDWNKRFSCLPSKLM